MVELLFFYVALVLIDAFEYVVLFIAIITIGVYLTRTLKGKLKLIGVLIAIAPLAYPIVSYLSRVAPGYLKQTVSDNVIKINRHEASRYFNQRCKAAYLEITEHPKHAKGIELLNLPYNTLPPDMLARMEDGSPHPVTQVLGLNVAYVKAFLQPSPQASKFLSFVDYVSEEGVRYRFTLNPTPPNDNSGLKLDMTKVSGAAELPKYGLKWERLDLVKKDIDHGVSGGWLKVVDIHQKKVIAERKQFAYDNTICNKGLTDGRVYFQKTSASQGVQSIQFLGYVIDELVEVPKEQ